MGLDSVELVMAVEEEFSLTIPDHIAEKLFSVGALHSFVVEELGRTGKPQNAQAVFERLREVICTQLRVKPERVTADARFVQDLGLD